MRVIFSAASDSTLCIVSYHIAMHIIILNIIYAGRHGGGLVFHFVNVGEC